MERECNQKLKNMRYTEKDNADHLMYDGKTGKDLETRLMSNE